MGTTPTLGACVHGPARDRVGMPQGADSPRAATASCGLADLVQDSFVGVATLPMQGFQLGCNAVSWAMTARPPTHTLQVQTVNHRRIDLRHLQPGDIGCVHLPRFRKTARQLGIALAQRWHHGRFKRLPFDETIRGSVNVVHAFIVLKVDSLNGLLTVAEASGRRGVCEAVFNFENPADPESHVVRGANYLFYRLRDPREKARLAQVAATWVAAGGAYDRCGATVAPVRRNSLGAWGRRRILELTHRMDEPLRAADGTPQPMFCSQFVARAWAAVAVESALGVLPNRGADLESAAQQHLVSETFHLDTDAVLPSSLHRELLADSRVKTLGFFPDDDRQSGLAATLPAAGTADVFGFSARDWQPALWGTHPKAWRQMKQVPLWQVALRGHEPLLAQRLARSPTKENINSKSPDGWTPLFAAVHAGQTQCVRLLLEAGADSTLKTADGWTPLRYAEVYGLRDMAAILR